MDNETAIRQLLDTYAQSINRTDIELAATIWKTDDDPIFIHPRGTERGWTQIVENFYGETMGKLLDHRDLEIKNVNIDLFDDTAIVVFEWDFHATLRADNSPLVTHGRETQVLRKLNGMWRIAHVHYSGLPVTEAGKGF
ncbi:MAG: nuclear transport factor 2 family protein [Thermoguttaceae bacterium]|nr:nuclear transport factor 2 family protein [Thermoguttaceae bacterium]MBQ2682568.1 nuclear transport factor 2 family protein [Thermoguttaceae bacterium]MBQ3332303.1 nuclear transport factor 2 family protein [Thermoguttaceae bacterium]MBQ6619874.1 nuclear transport factor 2 family protein [Thermoguttaceae bacterium]MBR2585137.1 nuclear transport factor 2 family protein [Thermoguttaceae bacterium]